MPFSFLCPHCQQELEAEEELIGQTLACPSCGNQLTANKEDIDKVHSTSLPKYNEIKNEINQISKETITKTERVNDKNDTSSKNGYFVFCILISFILFLIIFTTFSSAPIVARVTSPTTSSHQDVHTLEEVLKSIETSTKELNSKNNDIPQGMTKAFEQYRIDAERGDAYAQYRLGMCYAHGVVVGKNMTEALKWYRKAAFGGVVPAQFIIEPLCDANDCYRIGEIYWEGKGKDVKEAVKWFTKAANLGHVESQFKLGVFYAAAHQDSLARFWLNKAASAGREEAKTLLQLQKAGMIP